LIAGDRVLVKNQTTATANGVYVVASGSWTRATDADASSEVLGLAVYVNPNGVPNTNTYGGTQWANSNSTVTLGSTNITFSQIAGAGTYTNGAGINLTSNVFSTDNSYIKGLFSTNYTQPLSYNLTTGVFSFDTTTTSGGWHSYNYIIAQLDAGFVHKSGSVTEIITGLKTFSSLLTVSAGGAAITGDVSTTGRFIANTTTSGAAGSFGYNATYGTFIAFKNGTVNDFALFNQGGAELLVNTHGTNDFVFTGKVSAATVNATAANFVNTNANTAYLSTTLPLKVGNLSNTAGAFTGIRFEGVTNTGTAYAAGSVDIDYTPGASALTSTMHIRIVDAGSFAEKLRITTTSVGANANLLAITDNSFDIGASGATRFRDFFLARNAVIGGTLSVTGISTFGASATINGALSVGNNSTRGIIILNGGSADVPTLNFTDSRTSGRNYTIYVGALGVGTFSIWDETNNKHRFVMDGNGHIYPGNTNVQTLGDATHLWSNFYTTLATISSNATVGGTLGVTGTSTLAAANLSGALAVSTATTIQATFTSTSTSASIKINKSTESGFQLYNNATRQFAIYDIANSEDVLSFLNGNASFSHNVNIAGTLAVTGVATFSANPIVTAASAVYVANRTTVGSGSPSGFKIQNNGTDAWGSR
jgi:hypothetical protein